MCFKIVIIKNVDLFDLLYIIVVFVYFSICVQAMWPTPIFSHVAVTGSHVVSATFIPHKTKSIYRGTTLSWQDKSALYFMNRAAYRVTERGNKGIKDEERRGKYLANDWEWTVK